MCCQVEWGHPVLVPGHHISMIFQQRLHCVLVATGGSMVERGQPLTVLQIHLTTCAVCVCMCVCACACMCVCVCVCVFVYTYTHVQTMNIVNKTNSFESTMVCQQLEYQCSLQEHMHIHIHCTRTHMN